VAPRYPNLHVNLTGLDGNLLLILSRTNRAFIDAHVPNEEHQCFLDEFCGTLDYERKLTILAQWVDVNLNELTDFEGYRPE